MVSLSVERDGFIYKVSCDGQTKFHKNRGVGYIVSDDGPIFSCSSRGGRSRSKQSRLDLKRPGDEILPV